MPHTASPSAKWWTLVAMTGALSMILIDETVVSVALPSIQRSLDLSSTQTQWVVNAYLLTLAAFVALGGRLSDMIGRVPAMTLAVIAALFLLRRGAFAAQQPEVEPVPTHPLAAHATPRSVAA